MTNVIIAALTQAAADVGNIETALEEANALAVPPTTAMLTPGADEVSAAITALFNGHAQAYQELAAQAAGFHRQFTALLAQAGAAYQTTEQAESPRRVRSLGFVAPDRLAGLNLTVVGLL